MTDSAAKNTPLTDIAPATFRLVCPQMPLTVYREVAAHLRQVDGIEVDLLPQTSQQFNYRDSQIGGLCLRYTSASNAVSRQRVEQILRYYADRFGVWERLDSAS